MVKIRKEYYKAVKKYGTRGVLNLYRDGKMKLNGKEWNNLHRRIEKENNIYHGIELNILVNMLVCFLIIVIIAVSSKETYIDKIKKCNYLKGHMCVQYEIDKMEG